MIEAAVTTTPANSRRSDKGGIVRALRGEPRSANHLRSAAARQRQGRIT